MQDAEMEDDGSVLKYMTKSEIEEQRSSLHIMTHPHLILMGKTSEDRLSGRQKETD